MSTKRRGQAIGHVTDLSPEDQPVLTANSRTEWALWQLSVIMAEIAAQSQVVGNDPSQGSGIRTDVNRKRGYRPIVGKTELESLGFCKAQCAVPGILIALWSVDGQKVGYAYRPDNPRLDPQGKTTEYENANISSPKLRLVHRSGNNPEYLWGHRSMGACPNSFVMRRLTTAPDGKQVVITSMKESIRGMVNDIG